MVDDGNGRAVVTTAMIYEAVLELQADVRPLVSAVADHESRIRRNEAWRYGLPPALVMALVSLVVALR